MEDQKRFRDEHRLPFPLLSDEGGKVAKRYGGTMPVVGFAKRATYVVGEDRKVKEVITGDDAIDPGGAITACPLRKPAG